MPTSTELKAQAAAAREAVAQALTLADELTAAARKAEREERHAKERAEYEAHYTRMFEEVGQPLVGLNPAQHAIVYSQAWEQGHSSGYQEVESYYGDFAEAARKILDAN